MSLELYLGSSGAGKSHRLYSEIIEKSIEYPERNFIVVVPEQYTMAIQKRLVGMHPRKGILNIDVVSFERLAFKVFEEVGEDTLTVLDDTGKNLIIKRVLEQNKRMLKFFGNNLSNTGFVSEMKSVISEMLQYGVAPEQIVNAATSLTGELGSSALQYKIDDIVTVYNAFLAYIDKNYITKEEILDRLCKRIGDSKIIKNSEIAFDGFTGFTPIQYNLLRILLKMCPKVSVTLTIDAHDRINVISGKEELFYMSKDCYARLMQICDEEQITVAEPVLIDDSDKSRFRNSAELKFLEKNIFRNNREVYGQPTADITIYEAPVAREEITFAAGEIIRLTRLAGYRYSEIAIVTADMESYGSLTANILKQNDIPYFLDYKRHVTDNPFISAVSGALSVIEEGYSYSSVFGLLRTGMCGIAREDIDFLDNYCIAVGVRSRKRWHEEWTQKFRRTVNNSDLDRLNSLRQSVIDMIDPLEEKLKNGGATVSDMVAALYEFLVAQNMQSKVSKLNDSEYTGDEYAQLYGKVIELLDKMYYLLGTERVSVREFAKIVRSGFEEIKIGLIPQTNDCVVIGDIERTRLDSVRAVFFIGVNDGNVPRRAESRSVLSEADRECLEDAGVSMSPSVREKAFTQRFYLYLIMTKSSEKLYMSYAQKNSAGAPLIPSYLIRNMRKLFSHVRLLRWRDTALQNSYVSVPGSDIVYKKDDCESVAPDIIYSLMGGKLVGNVTSFETYASCRLKYYLRYGLDIREREEFTFSVMDFGTIIHAVLKDVCDEIKRDGESYSLISEEKRRAMVKRCVEAETGLYQNSVLNDNSRNRFLVKRIEELADRTVWAVCKQISDGSFTPFAFEHKFDIEISGGEHTQRMNGIIDRIDVCDDPSGVYVRIIDYKTGSKDFNLLRTYYGTDIQLMVYMEAAMKLVARNYPDREIIPAGVFYYNVSDPIVNAYENNSLGTEEKIRKALRLKGIVNSNDAVIKLMDTSDGDSLTIPVARKNTGELKASSKLMSEMEFTQLGRFVDMRAVNTARLIMDGDIARNPYKDGQQTSCDWCPYAAICGFSVDLPGCTFRVMKKFDNDTLWNNIAKGVDENGEKMDRQSEEVD